MGGRLTHFLSGWKKVTTDRWVLNIIREGLKLEFISTPIQVGLRETKFKTFKENEIVKNELMDLLSKQAIERVPPSQEGLGYYSTIFLVPKKDGGFRPILNLKELNKHLQVPHFKMETFRNIRQALNVGDWAFKIDLKDAYFHIKIFADHRKFLRFTFQGTHFQFRSLPFGLCTAPACLPRSWHPWGGFLRSQHIHIFMYLDDWLVKNQVRDTLLNQKEFIIETLKNLGLLMNPEKSSLIPTQTISYLGALLDLKSGLIYPSEEKFQNMSKQVRHILSAKKCTAREFLRLLGLMASCLDLIPGAHLQMRPAQFHLMSWWSASKDPLEKMIPSDMELISHLNWWTDKQNFFKGVPLKMTTSLVLWTDASEVGWGAHLNSLQTQGLWEPLQKVRHINWLELKAVQLALKEFLPQVKNKNILIRSDNSTVVAYLNKEGGTKSLSLCHLTWEILQWAVRFGVNLKAAHVPGKKNIIADNLSRGRTGPRLTEWALNKKVINQVFSIFQKPNIDLFATRENRQLKVFCSPWPMEEAWSSDALSVDWTGMFAYA